jgi:hypothetical protein
MTGNQILTVVRAHSGDSSWLVRVKPDGTEEALDTPPLEHLFG